MAIRTYSVPWISGKLYQRYYNSSTNSTKVNGKLRLTSNNHEFFNARVTSQSSNFSGNDCQGAETVEYFPFTGAQYNAVYGRFAGKLRAGSADLGVTAATWQQSADMIVDRCEKLRDFFSLRRASRRRSRRRPQRDDRFSRGALASDVLEGEFGWLPLLQDIHNVLFTVCGEKAIPDQWVRASSQFALNEHIDNGSGSEPRIVTSKSGRGRITISAKVEIENPNLWLLNRLGIINPAVVAWDLVPWSFVVNMFVNVNQVLGSLTDTVGLNLSQCSVTRSASILREQQATWNNAPLKGRFSRTNVNAKTRSRVVGVLPRPSLVMRVPNVDWNLCVIASALVVQKVRAFH